MSPVAINTHVQAAHQDVSNLSKNPLQRTWRGDKEGTLTLVQAYPACATNGDLVAKRQWIKE